jgi:succinyl-CoA synthetase beta subunit
MRQLEGEEMEQIFVNIFINILIPTYIFHGIIVASQSLHRHTYGQHLEFS